jgi:hypothetical protein
MDATDSLAIAILSPMNPLQTVSFLRPPICTLESRIPQPLPSAPHISMVLIPYM